MQDGRDPRGNQRVRHSQCPEFHKPHPYLRRSDQGGGPDCRCSAGAGDFKQARQMRRQGAGDKPCRSEHKSKDRHRAPRHRRGLSCDLGRADWRRRSQRKYRIKPALTDRPWSLAANHPIDWSRPSLTDRRPVVGRAGEAQPAGMKAAVNGVLNLSVLDGWWIEACVEGVNGWSIGDDPAAVTDENQAAVKLYDKLEQTILPLYYDDRAGWRAMMKQSIATIASYFNTHRMMRRYATEAYLR
jgi:hypothetical protein